MAKITEQKLAAMLNNLTYKDYYDRLKLLAISMFEWQGLDEIGGNTRFLEESLFNTGVAVFIKDKRLGYMTLNCDYTGLKNNYGEPTSIYATGFNYNQKYQTDDVVIIKNNLLELPTTLTIQLFANRLYECQRSIDVNISTMKYPTIVEGDEKSMLTLKNLVMQWQSNIPIIYGRKNYSIQDKINALNLNTPIVFDKLTIQKHEIWNECLTFLGINNSNIDKKERMIVSEAESNDELISYYLNCFYKTRKKACDEINKKFFNGKEKIKLKLNDDILKLLEKLKSDIINIREINEKEGESNGEIYDNNKTSTPK